MANSIHLSPHLFFAPFIFSFMIGCSGDTDNEAETENTAQATPAPSSTPTSSPTPTPSSAPSPTPTITPTPFSGSIIGDCQPSELEMDLWQSHNSARAESRYCEDDYYEAVPALNWHCKLQEAAENHSTDMAVQDYFEHLSPDGSRFWDRTDEVGYENFAQGENIAAGYNTVARVMTGWLDSPGHCRNLMGSTHTEMGGSKVDASGASYSSYWTVIFGRD